MYSFLNAPFESERWVLQIHVENQSVLAHFAYWENSTQHSEDPSGCKVISSGHEENSSGFEENSNGHGENSHGHEEKIVSELWGNLTDCEQSTVLDWNLPGFSAVIPAKALCY